MLAFGTIDRRRADVQAKPTTECGGVTGHKARAIVTEPLHRRREASDGAEPCLDALDHQVPHQRSIYAACGGP